MNTEIIDTSKLTEQEKHYLVCLYGAFIHFTNCGNSYYLFSKDKQEKSKELETLFYIKENVKQELNKLHKELFKNKKEI